MSNTVYANKIIEGKAKDLLTTKVNARSLMTIDDTLEQNAGMVKTVNTYTYTGVAEALANGVGNTAATRGSIAYVGKDYTVGMLQQAFDYTDEDYMKDNLIVDFMTKGATQVMANKLTTDFYGALTAGAASIASVEFTHGGAIGYGTIVDAIAELNIEDESELFLLISPEWKGDIRKDPDYKSAQMGEVVYNGQIGTVCGIPVIVTKALTDEAYLMTKEAVTCFMKKDIEVEQDRNADTRTNSVYLRTAYVCALTDATKVCHITEAAQ